MNVLEALNKKVNMHILILLVAFLSNVLTLICSEIWYTYPGNELILKIPFGFVEPLMHYLGRTLFSICGFYYLGIQKGKWQNPNSRN